MSHMGDDDVRADLVATARRLEADGLNVGASGNFCVRVGRDVFVTPSGMPPAAMEPRDMVRLGPDGTVRDGDRLPTSEWRLHVEILAARQDVGAVVHTHSPEATAAAVLGGPVPPVHYVVARFGKDRLPCAPYATYGTEALARGVVATLGRDGRACLMANHGAVAVAADLEGAAALARDVEWLCGVYRRSLQLGSPVVLGDDEIARVAARFAEYGQPRPPAAG